MPSVSPVRVIWNQINVGLKNIEILEQDMFLLQKQFNFLAVSNFLFSSPALIQAAV